MTGSPSATPGPSGSSARPFAPAVAVPMVGAPGAVAAGGGATGVTAAERAEKVPSPTALVADTVNALLRDHLARAADGHAASAAPRPA